MRHLIDIRDLTQAEIVSLLDLADDIMARREDYREVCRYKSSRRSSSSRARARA